MIPRRWSRLFFLLIFLFMVVVLYNMLQSIGSSHSSNETDEENRIRQRLHNLENSIKSLDKAMNEKEIEPQNVRPIPPPPSSPIVEPVDVVMPKKKTDIVEATDRCVWRKSMPTNTTLEIRQLYETLPFDDENGGVWKQGFDIKYERSQWTSDRKLKIILMPHSHCDPGWIQTFEEYFNRATKHIINTVIEALNMDPKYRFVWAEISFLSLWWDQASKDQRELLKKFLNNGQLEIVTGGWVMNDEANTHYFAMLDQLIEGHQFIEHNLGNISIRAGWANDPFGYSPTMAYLLHGIGVKYMAIQRVHYHIKKALAKEKKLEFYWQQTWDRQTSTRILTHVMPFYSYDVPHTCGPDPKVCCQFDFRRSANSDMSCPWGVQPVAITNENVPERAELLLDQYRKKSQLYRTNVLFIQLGDDFRYVTMDEARKQFENYNKLFTYMNSRSDWNVEARFGTLSEYFEELQEKTSNDPLPSYMGDFFTYADRVDHYWSGYYTSRSFFKRMDRIVESYLRASEILFSVAQVKSFESKMLKAFPSDELYRKLIQARRNLGVFQHHDGVTGTAKEHVVNDYGEKLFTAISSSQTVLEQSAGFLLFGDEFINDRNVLKINDHLENYQSLPTKKLISLTKEGNSMRVIYLYNPTDQRRHEIVRILVDSAQVSVSNNQKRISHCQIEPKWKGRKSNSIDSTQFELSFLAELEAYSLKAYTIQLSGIEQVCPLVKIQYFSNKNQPNNSSALFTVDILNEETVELSNKFISIGLSKNGNLLHFHHLEHNEKILFNIDAIHYGTRTENDRNSGAYLFLPNGEATNIPIGPNDLVRIQRGPLTSRIEILHEMFVFQYQLSHTNGSIDHSIEVFAHTHLQLNNDFELALRITTAMKNGAEFFTDLNGFQVIRRKTYEKLPLQGNVYPMASLAYLEDDHMRLTVLTGQPSGVASLKSGVLDLFLDRRLLRDDNRGLGHGVTDNRAILSHFRLLFEPRRTVADRSSLTGYPTLRAHHQSIELLYPIQVLQSTSNKIVTHEWNLFNKANLFPSDYHLVNLRTLTSSDKDSNEKPSKDMALILRRFAYDCDETYDSLFHFEQPIVEHFFSSQLIDEVFETSLSLRYSKKSISSSTKLNIPMAELMTHRLKMK